MKKIDTYILEKILINKDTKLKRDVAADHIDELTICDELYMLLDDEWNNIERWKRHFGDDAEKAREELFDDIQYMKSKYESALSALMDNDRLSEDDVDEYSTNNTVWNVFKELADRISHGKHIDINKIYNKYK